MSLRIRKRLVATTAMQAACLKAAANITAQVATVWKLGPGPGHPAALDWGRVAEFSFYGFVSAGLGFPWQHWLEYHFPTKTTPAAAATHGAAVGSWIKGVPGQQPQPQVHDGHDPDDPEKKQPPSARGRPPPSPDAQQQPSAQAPLTPGSGGVASSSATASISWLNVTYKLVLDQTLWLLFTTTIFLIFTNVLRVPSGEVLFQVWKEKTWYIIKAAWHVWPLVAICNFAFVPVDYRVLVAACVGFAWNVFLSLITMSNG
ncbi:hypothetical protein RB600_004580 [Gaeumannomyces tritici]